MSLFTDTRMSETIRVVLPDNTVREYPKGITPHEIAESISKGLAQKAIAAKVNDQVVETNRAMTTDSSLQLLTWEDPEGKATFWHSSAHILAEAVEALFPGVKFGIGPPIDNGFYYDIDFGDKSPTPEDLIEIEKKFLELAQSGETFERREITKAAAIAYFQQKQDPYKLELLQELEDGKITFYYSGNFVDLCKGPHIPNSKIIKAVKILNIAGAYWRGNEKNKQLTRLYAISFPTQKELTAYLNWLEEVKKRDHRRIGKEMDMFSFHEEGPGFPFWHHNGMVVMNELQKFLRRRLLDIGYEEIKTPIILNEELWHRSGHYDNYKENMYFTTIDEVGYAVKPMNCPGSTVVYRTRRHTHKSLPLRMFEFGLVHRHELSGVLTGLFRVRAFTQDDAHIFCTPEQVETEITKLIELIFGVYATFGFEKVSVYLSTRPEKYIGSLEIWNQAEAALQQALQKANVSFQINAGDGAFYGPKIDFVVKDSLNRNWQLGTVQLDFSMPMRFDLKYIGADDTEHRPVMIHRAVLGSFERFIGVLLEHTGGNLPLWLMPTQAIVLPISEHYNAYAHQIANAFNQLDYRVGVDIRNEKINRKIRDAEVQKIPFMFIVGQKEFETQEVAVRIHTQGDTGSFKLDAAIEMFTNAVKQSYFPVSSAN